MSLDAFWLALIVGGAALVVLLAVAASGLGPIASLKRTLAGYAELGDELDRLRRNLELLQASRERELD